MNEHVLHSLSQQFQQTTSNGATAIPQRYRDLGKAVSTSSIDVFKRAKRYFKTFSKTLRTFMMFRSLRYSDEILPLMLCFQNHAKNSCQYYYVIVHVCGFKNGKRPEKLEENESKSFTVRFTFLLLKALEMLC